MPSAAEAATGGSQLQSTLDAGLEQLSADELVTFTLYSRFALGPDSSVFWVASATTMTAKGSLHVATDRHQNEDETLGMTTAIFTSEQLVTEFLSVAPGTMWIGSWAIPEGTLQVAFASRGRFYQQAALYHYSGYCVFPAMQSQLVASALDLPQGPIVSNSLPIWLAQNQMAPVYPSFLVAENIVPPYIVAHIEPSGTQALGAFPLIGPWPGTVVPDSGASPLHEMASWQLARDEVTLTLYGFTNAMAIQYFGMLVEVSRADDAPFGFANSPIISDAKRIQTEISSLAQKKTIGISANYYQGTADAIARRLILSALVSSITIVGGNSRFGQGSVVQDAQTVNAIGTLP